MRNRTPALLCAALVLAACADAPTTPSGIEPAAPAATGDAAVLLDELASDAAARGDGGTSSDLADGALAIRLGAEPTEIAMAVGGQEYRYWALVIGILERQAGGAEALTRRFVAWTGDPRVSAALRTVSRADQAAFARDEDPADVGRAIGTFVDFVRSARFAAIDGSILTVLNSVAGSCPNAARDPRFECHLARYDVRMDGTFELVGDADVRLPIATSPPSVAGIVIHRTDGGSGGRPGVSVSRPQSTRK